MAFIQQSASSLPKLINNTFGFGLSTDLNKPNSSKTKQILSKPNDIPTNVSRKYKNEGWVSYKDFLWSNIHRKKHSKFRSYEDAKAFVHTLNLSDYKNWKDYLKGNLKGNCKREIKKEIKKRKFTKAI